MFKKLASSLILGSLLVSSAFAGDFLAKISNGALSDNSQGVKALNLDEMKQVKGGYLVGFINIGNNEIGALAITTINAHDAGVSFGNRDGSEIKYDKKGKI